MNKVILILFIVVALLFVVVFRIEIKKNELEAEKEALAETYNELDYENKKKKNELEKDLDDEEISKIAKDKLDYVEPNSEYYYGD